ncbi:DUF362 domain-containing protein [Candidatus Woesearchaeota archaeon]|nr:DUF362 domain-containing protein [Candidatus Woesearchaeota archaeon]
MKSSNKNAKSVVAVLKTTPERVVKDYGKAMRLAGYKEHISPNRQTILKLNLSWTLYYPACSTEPWQLEGVLNALKEDGFKKENVLAVENQTVVTEPWKGAYYNKWLPILKDKGVQYKPLTNVKWVKYRPKAKMLAMKELFGEILVPEIFFKSNVIHFPTVKTHGHTTTTGTMKNAFGGLIPKYRHHAHRKIHEVLVDLLAIQKEIHPGMFAVMDGCVCGNGAGPRTMEPYSGNVILASSDQVAIDAVAAKMMGFNPMKIPYIRMAHERGLGCGDVSKIEIVGMKRSEFQRINFRFRTHRSPVILGDQLLRKGTAGMPFIHNLLFRSPIFRSFIFGSEFYHDYIWYPTIGKKKIKEFSPTPWGQKFEKYPYGPFPKYKKVKSGDPY